MFINSVTITLHLKSQKLTFFIVLVIYGIYVSVLIVLLNVVVQVLGFFICISLTR